MKVRFHAVLLFIPLGLWGLWFGINAMGQTRIDRYFKNVNGLSWEFDTREVNAELKASKQGEVERFAIKIINDENQILYDTTFQIDWDMGGGGFVKAVQADKDPGLEIVFFKKGGKSNFYLHVSADKVIQKDFKSASKEVQILAEERLKYFAPNPFSLGLGFVSTLAFYILYFPLYWISQKLSCERRKIRE